METANVSIDIQTFLNEVTKRSIMDDAAAGMQRAMDLLYLVIYSPVVRIGDVDFSLFTLKDGERAYDAIRDYEADDIDDGDEEENKQNLLVEINRVGHAAGISSSLKAKKTPRRFF
ncbi:hypothetical protein PV433_10750 [Paenibacillus sp. GYB004]|uniref:hypothetical protein n=1 Tax=Paenibacillus sp. GYB004 TaxID=2994393 RepID=UPI002F96D59B